VGKATGSALLQIAKHTLVSLSVSWRQSGLSHNATGQQDANMASTCLLSYLLTDSEMGPKFERLRRQIKLETNDILLRVEIEYKARHKESTLGVVG
jgi:hypothetical protein